jgi:branched-chain amino acid transport system substrate-binding protein
MLSSRALTTIQTTVLISIIVISSFAAVLAYFLFNGQYQSAETIKIGVLADLDGVVGRAIWQGTKLAAEQINAEGGLMGKQIEVIGEDTDVESGSDTVKINSALTRLLTFHNVDFIVGISANEGFMIQELIAQHKKIFFDIASTEDAYTQRVLDDYDSYKYYFRDSFNATSIFQGMIDGFLHFRELTGLNKIGYLAEDLGWAAGIIEGLDVVLPELGFDLVYKGKFPVGTVDFSSYFAAAEAAGVEVMVPLIALSGAIPFVKEYRDRQSPTVVYGGALGGGVTGPEGWEITDGKCEYTTSSALSIFAGYPLTSKTLPVREAYMNRWDELPSSYAAAAYDILRYILADAIERAGTLEVNAVIDALETTSIETTNAKNFVFTSSHDLMMGENPNNPDADYTLVIYFQWQNEELVPVYPKKIMEAAGATYMFPDWPGPWD